MTPKNASFTGEHSVLGYHQDSWVKLNSFFFQTYKCPAARDDLQLSAEAQARVAKNRDLLAKFYVTMCRVLWQAGDFAAWPSI